MPNTFKQVLFFYMKLKCCIGLLCLIFCLPIISFAQSAGPDLQKVRTLVKNNKILQANILLDSYLKRYPKDPYVHWLYAHYSRQMGRKSTSNKHYEKAIQLSDGNRVLQMEYGRSLFKDKQLKKSLAVFDTLLQEAILDSLHYEALVMKVYNQYGLFDLEGTQRAIDSVLKVAPQFDYIKEVEDEIRLIRAPYLSIGTEYSTDHQPLNSLNTNLEAGMVKGKFFNPFLQVNNYNFKTDSSTNVLKANFGNIFILGTSGLKLKTSLGLVQNFSSNKNTIIAGVDLTKKLLGQLYANLGWNRNPYLGTKFSVMNPIVESKLTMGLAYTNPKVLELNLNYGVSSYDIGNTINAFSFWGMSGPIPTGPVKWNIGYGFSYANAKEIMYNPIFDTTGNLQILPENGQVIGEYNPIYTPSKETVHSVIGGLRFDFSSSFSWSSKVIYGFSGQNYVPQLFITDESEQDQYEPNLYLAKYNPLSFQTALSKEFSKFFSMNVQYQRQKTFYYVQDKVGMSLLFRFL